MSKTVEKTAWAFWANINGPWWKTPQKVMWNEDLKSWWRKCGDAEVDQMGLFSKDNVYVTFASYDKKEVERFIEGFMAARMLMKNFVCS